MGKLEIAKRLKEYREKTGLTVYQVGELLGKSGKTVSAWENGRGQPDADMFLALCEIYNVNSVGIFLGENEKKHEANKNEQAHIKKYRRLNDANRQAVDFTIDGMLTAQDAQKKGAPGANDAETAQEPHIDGKKAGEST